jgi:hypothetical protein
MKSLLAIIAAILLVSCFVEEDTYTIKGRFLNGTTNLPYQNVKVEITKIIGPSGFSKFTDLGTVTTNVDGEFSLSYSIRASESGTLQLVFGGNGITEMLVKGGIDLARNNSMDFYLSDSCRTIFSFQTSNPLGDNEVLKVYPYTGAFDTLVFTKSDLNASDFKYHLRTKSMFGAVGVDRVSADTTISIFNATFEMETDPIINNITIIY